MKIDLHNHSTHSDGLYSVSELVDIAIKNKIDVMALTDHDSVFGIKEIINYSKDKNILVIPGIELSTVHNNESVHIIGLFKEGYVPDEMYQKSYEIKDIRRKRAIDMLNKIKNIFGVEIDLDEVLEREVLTRGNMYQHIMKHNPQIPISDVNKMVSHSSPAYIEVARFTASEGIKFLHDNNCITILAHPTLNSLKTVEEVCKMGIDGIEYLYPKNKDGEEEKFIKLAQKYNLLLSAGSDFHGDKNHANIGTVSLDETNFNKIKEKLKI